MERIIIRLIRNTALVDWCHVDVTGHVIEAQYRVEKTSIPKIPEVNVILLIPTSDTLILNLDLPEKIGPKHWRAAAESSLEESLSQDIDEIHFSISPPQDGHYPAIVVQRKFLVQWLREFHELGIEITQMLPDCFLLPVSENQPSVWLDNGLAIVRLSNSAGCSIEANLLPQILPTLDRKLCDPTQNPAPSDYFRRWVMNLPSEEALNLLQDEFAPARPYAVDTTQWMQWAATVFVSWFVLFIAGYSIEWGVFHARNQLLDNSISTMYREVFPGATSVVTPKERVERELAKLNRTGTKTDFLPVMSIVEKVYRSMPEITIVLADYQHAELQLQVKAKDFQQLEKLDKELVKNGLSVKRETATTSADGVAARFSVSGGAV